MQAAPLNQYVKKEVRYVLSARSGVEVVVETDDDNYPVDGFWSARTGTQGLRARSEKFGWVNAYRCFSDSPKCEAFNH